LVNSYQRNSGSDVFDDFKEEDGLIEESHRRANLEKMIIMGCQFNIRPYCPS